MDMAIMNEEIFGPVLPVFAWDTHDVNAHSWRTPTSPCACTVFQPPMPCHRVDDHHPAGTTAINEVIFKWLSPNLPFGGIQTSGMGRTGGIHGFKQFSNMRSVVRQTVRFNAFLGPFLHFWSKGLRLLRPCNVGCEPERLNSFDARPNAFPRSLSRSRYDQYLASGWFRGSVMLYKMDFCALTSRLFSVVNIRMNLDHHMVLSRQRKIMRRVESRFTVTYGHAQPNANKEALYQQHKSRFKGFIHNTLTDYLSAGFAGTVFDTREVCVYDGDRLIAVSYFDLGEQSMASLLGLYDEAYAKH